MNTYHVVPVNDLIDHDTMTDQADCVCGPAAQVQPTPNSDGWIIVHNSLDGREARE